MSVNKWIGIGNLTKDPLLKYTPSGVAVCNFSIACNERYKDKQGEQQETVEFINIVVWRQLAEICGKYLVKGKQVYIEGKMQTRSWEPTDGSGKRYTTEIVASEMQMIGAKGNDNTQPGVSPQQAADVFGGQVHDESDIPF